MTESSRTRELGRGERVLPGVWRLRLPLPWPGVPHCNAWALAAGDGIVLVDCGMDQPGSMAHLERALEQVNLRLDLVRLLVCTHAHSDHYGQAAAIVKATGCELWMHPNHAHTVQAATDPEAALERRIEVAILSGVPQAPLRAYAEQAKGRGSGFAGIVEPARDLLPGVQINSDLGAWEVVETPGHAPSHVCLYQPENRLMISGDHLLGRPSLYYDYGWTEDPVGEYLNSLELIEDLDMRLCLPGHGRSFAEVGSHINANRLAIAERIDGVIDALAQDQPMTAFEVVQSVHGDELTAINANWWLSETLCYLRHLEVTDRAQRSEGDEERPELWELTGSLHAS